jgi:hypothetical protein
MTRIIQIQRGEERAVAVVAEPRARGLAGVRSVVELARQAIAAGESLASLIRQKATDEWLDYDAIYHGASEWRLLPPVDHPEEPARCLISGTGLTHLGSARDRHDMHTRGDEELTDSMKMFQWGVNGGKAEPGAIGISPEWFYKGTGAILRAHGEPLEVPPFGEDGGEEAEVAGVYFNDENGQPWRLGMAIGNEFSDHAFEKKNYLNLAGSKIRTCALGPELVVAPDFQYVLGKVAIERSGREIWSKKIATGEAEMCHSLANLEHHHFKFDGHRRPGDVHVHYFGADTLSFGAGLKLLDGDVMSIHFADFGRPLRNPVRIISEAPRLVAVRSFA